MVTASPDYRQGGDLDEAYHRTNNIDGSWTENEGVVAGPDSGYRSTSIGDLLMRIDPDSPAAFKEACACALETSAPQIQFWNDRAILDILATRYPEISREKVSKSGFLPFP